MFDLRSDTVTRPTEAMRKAMAEAPVGDDVFGDDPTVNHFEEFAAEMFGKEAALFVPSGTMGNQICLGTLSGPGDEVIAEADSHILQHEVGSAARLWGTTIRSVKGQLGMMDPGEVEGLIRDPGDIHYPRTSVLSLENTHNFAGGCILPLDYIDGMVAVARRHDLNLHMDGARIFNAQVGLDVPVSRIVRDMDLVSTCLSKGLGAPVGSVVVGNQEKIDQCRQLRKALGGGMRQVGVLAAAGLLALEQGPVNLAEDHRRARTLAEALDDLEGCTLDLASVQTNIVIATVASDAYQFEDAFAEHGVGMCAIDRERIRFVFHRDAGDDALDAAVVASRALLA